MCKFENWLIEFAGIHCRTTVQTLSISLAILIMTCATSNAAATLPPGNTIQQWNTIAENTVVGSGAFRPRALSIWPTCRRRIRRSGVN